MRFDLEPSRGIGNLVRIPLIRKSFISLLIFVIVGGLKKGENQLFVNTYDFLRKAYTLKIDYQNLIDKLQIREAFGQGRWIKIWEQLDGLGGKQLEKSGDVGKQSVWAPSEGELVARFGPRIHPIYGDERIHTGIDIACPEGEPIKAVLKGTIVKVEDNPTYGKTVLIDHGNGLKTFYAHCSNILTAEQKQVEAGEIIAEVGNTGLSTNPHLHFEVWKNDVSVNPEEVFSFLTGGD
jgi:murein DD-endopeptidase MepM/ murein hydrolase activator NlpD